MADMYGNFLSWLNQGGSPMQGGATQPMQSSTPFMDMLNLQREYGGNTNYGAPGSPETTGGLMAASPMTTGGNEIDRTMTLMDNDRGVMNKPQGQVGGMSSQARSTLEGLSDYFGGGLGPKGKAKLRGTGFDWAGGVNNFSRLAGGFAQALSPDSFGGRLGGLARTIADNDVQSQRAVDKTLMTGFMRQATGRQGSGNVQVFKPGDRYKNPDGSWEIIPSEVKPVAEKNIQTFDPNHMLPNPDGSFRRIGGPVDKGEGKVRDNFMSVPGGVIDKEGNFRSIPKVEKDQTPAERKEAREAEGAAAVVGGIQTQTPGIKEMPGTGWIWNDKVTVPSEEEQLRGQFKPIIDAEKSFERKALLEKALNKRIDDMRVANKNVPMPTRSQVEGRPGSSTAVSPATSPAVSPAASPKAVPDVVAPKIGLGLKGKPGKQGGVSKLQNFSPAAQDYIKQFGGPTMPTMPSKRR